MGLLDRLKSLGSYLAGYAERDRVVKFLPNRAASTPFGLWYNDKVLLASRMRDWNYVAISAVCEEMGCRTPQICRVVDGDEVEGQRTKSLREATSQLDRDLVRKAFRRKYRSKSLKRKALAHLQDSDELEPVSSDHPLVKLLQNPNGPDVSFTFWYRVGMYLKLIGTSYIWVVREKGSKRPCQLWVIPSHWVLERPVDENGNACDLLVGSYEIRPVAGVTPQDGDFGLGWFPGAGGSTIVPASEIIKIALPNPQSLTDGYSPIRAISMWVDASESIDSSRVQTFKNGAFPGVVLQLDKEVADPDEDWMERFKVKFAEGYEGVRKTRRPLVLAPGITIVPNQTSVEMDYVNSASQLKENILAAHRVGPTVAGMAEQTTYAAATAARAGFYQGTMRPLFMLIGQILSEKLCPMFEDDLVCFWDEPTPDDPDMLMKKVEMGLRSSLISPAEGRGIIFPELEAFEFGGDDPMQAPGQMPTGWITGEMPDMGMGGMPGMEGHPPGTMEPGTDQPEDDAAMDEVMAELLGEAPGNDGAIEQPGGIPSPLHARMNAPAPNGKH